MGIRGNGKDYFCGLGQVTQFLCLSFFICKVELVTVFYRVVMRIRWVKYVERSDSEQCLILIKHYINITKVDWVLACHTLGWALFTDHLCFCKAVLFLKWDKVMMFLLRYKPMLLTLKPVTSHKFMEYCVNNTNRKTQTLELCVLIPKGNLKLYNWALYFEWQTVKTVYFWFIVKTFWHWNLHFW